MEYRHKCSSLTGCFYMSGDDESRLLLLFVWYHSLEKLEEILLERLYCGISLLWFEESDTKQKTIASKNNILCKLSQMGASSVLFFSFLFFSIFPSIQKKEHSLSISSYSCYCYINITFFFVMYFMLISIYLFMSLSNH